MTQSEHAAPARARRLPKADLSRISKTNVLRTNVLYGARRPKMARSKDFGIFQGQKMQQETKLSAGYSDSPQSWSTLSILDATHIGMNW